MSFMFKTSTNIVPIINSGTYWGSFSYDRLWGWQAENLWDEEHAIVCDDYDFGKFGETLAHEASSVFEEERPMRERGVILIKANALISPKEYNFQDDALDLEVEVEDDFLDRAEELIMDPENKERVSKYIKRNWKTRDGFISGMPCESYEDLPQLFEDLRAAPLNHYYDEYRMWGSVLALVHIIDCGAGDGDECSEGTYTYLTKCLLEKIEGYDISDFCTVLSEDEWKGLYGKYLIDFDAFRKQLDEDTEKYCKSGVGEDSQAKARNYRNEVLKRVECYEREEQDAISTWHPKKYEVEAYLTATEKKWEEERDSDKWQEYWK